MVTLSGENNGNALYISIDGRVDSTNSDKVESEIKEMISGNVDVVIDADKLEYISSAGLRVLLRMRKSCPSLKIINASSEVYDIFEMTGFTEIITIEKAYRKLSTDGCEEIGQGANGKVYRLDADTIIKVYKNPDSLPDIHRERELARKAFVLGIPTAIPYDVVKVGNSFGSVFELLNATSFAKLINAEPENVDEYIDMYAQLLKKIHSTEVEPGDMPDMRMVAINWVEFLMKYLPEKTADKLVSMVKAVPTVKRMMHGDYHIKNVMMQNGEVLLIDMDTLCFGHPIFELASMYNAYIGFYAVDRSTIKDFLGISYDVSVHIWKKTLALYLDTEDESKLADVEDKAMIIGYTRLMRRLIRRGGLENERDRKEIDFYKSEIIRLVEKTDTLTF